MMNAASRTSRSSRDRGDHDAAMSTRAQRKSAKASAVTHVRFKVGLVEIFDVEQHGK